MTHTLIRAGPRCRSVDHPAMGLLRNLIAGAEVELPPRLILAIRHGRLCRRVVELDPDSLTVASAGWTACDLSVDEFLKGAGGCRR